jgi:hypothetical protein
MPLTKLDVARHQLGTALDLFIRDRDPIAVQCLECGGSELIEAIAKTNNVRPFSTHILETVPGPEPVRIPCAVCMARHGCRALSPTQHGVGSRQRHGMSRALGRGPQAFHHRTKKPPDDRIAMRR